MAEDQKILEKLKRLFDAEDALDADYFEKKDLLRQERRTLVGGGAGIGALLTRLEKHFSDTWRVRYGAAYIWNYSVDRAHWKRMLKTLRVEDLELRTINYLKNADDFYVKAKHSFAIFVRSINELAGEATSGDLTLDAAGPAGCLHLPRCKTDAVHTTKINRELRT